MFSGGNRVFGVVSRRFGVIFGRFGWFGVFPRTRLTVVPGTGLVESKGLGWYWVGLGNSVGGIGVVCDGKRFGVVLGWFWW